MCTRLNLYARRLPITCNRARSSPRSSLMDSSVPWKSYQSVHRYSTQNGPHPTAPKTSSVTQINRLFALCRPQTTEIGRTRPSRDRAESRATNGHGRSKLVSRERRFRCRNPPTILAREQLERNVVYDEPFGVLQHYVLDGKRDAGRIKTAQEEGRRAVERRRIPGEIFRHYHPANRSQSFVKQAM